MKITYITTIAFMYVMSTLYSIFDMSGSVKAELLLHFSHIPLTEYQPLLPIVTVFFLI